MKAMILAAGRGERMRPLTDSTPKPLLPVAGKPLIVWQIERLVAAGIVDLVINHAHLGQQIEAALGDGSAFGARIAYSAEGSALETAGGIATAAPLLGDEPFIVVSADIYVECDYRELAAKAQALGEADHAAGATAWLWMVNNRPWHPKGDFPMANGRLYPAADDSAGPKFTYSNLGIFSPRFFAGVTPGVKLAMRPILDREIAAGRVQAGLLEGEWHNLGTPEQLAALDRQLQH